MAGIREGQGELVFGLDIGTRSIVGTVGQLEGNKFHVMAQRAKEHETRAMLDGQIHDIMKVGETINQVKEMLEKDLDRSLTDVCIAAAGRVLRTITTFVEYQYENDREITDEDISALATMGVEKAYEEFQKTNDTDMKFYCVGYTPMRYYLNGYQMSNLQGHKAKTVGIDLIATFLPDDVVDGLYKAVELAGLRVANLTLEPIAAIQVAIPEKFRMLNMALVDVGAGTSDISITKDGTITAYGMIPIAGDSLTEIIVQHCLVDFETAEQIKRKSGVQETVEYADIMGLPQTITATQVNELLAPSVEKMTHMVAECIRELNGDKPVSAVFVVGGGGMISGYTEQLAEELEIVKERVAIRGQEVMQNIIFENEDARKDSLMVTPIGICLSFYEQSNNFIFVEFNGNRIKLYDNGRLSVADAAVQSQFSNEDLFPKRGKALAFTVNGKARMVRGLQGEAAVITVNGEASDIYAQIHNGDKVELVSSTMGEPAKQELGKLAELSDRLHVYVNGMKIDLPKTAEVNGVRQNEFYQIRENDDIQVRNSYTVREVAEFLDMPLGADLRVNDTAAKADTRVYENFTISWNTGKPYEEELPTEETSTEEALTEETSTEGTSTEETLTEETSTEETITEEILKEETPKEETISGEPSTEEISPNKDRVEAEPEQEVSKESVPESVNKEDGTQENQEPPKTDIYVIVNAKAVYLKGKPQYVFVDVFDVIDFDLKASRGRGIVTLLNGRPAQYMETLTEGDIIEIYWKE